MLGFSTRDLRLVQINESEKTLILLCPWKTTTNIAFHVSIYNITVVHLVSL